MLIYFDRQGAIREIVSSYTLSDGTASFKRAEGNSSANRIYCYFEGLAAALPSATAGAISYRLPDGSTIGPRVSDALETLSIDFDASRDLRHFAYDKDYAFLRFDVPDEVFSLSGLISATASATIGEATYQFGPITFMVDGEVLAQADIDYSQWQYLISQFARYLPLSGGTMTGGIVSEGTGRKATLDDGVLKLEDTVYGRETTIGKYAITADGGNFYYPPAAEAGGTLITDRWSGFQNYLPISGGEITGEITTNNDEIEQKVILGSGRIGVQDTDDGLVTYFDANYIERVGDKFYYPEWIESGGNLITNKWTGFDKYAKKTDLEDYAKKADLENYATKKDFDDLKSVVYGIHSLTYNSYEFSYLTSSAIPDEVDGRKVVGGSYAIMDWVGGNSVSFNQLVKNGNFADTSEWSAFGGVLTASGNVGSIVLSGAGSANRFQHVITPVLNHKYLVKFDIKASVTSRGYVQFGVMSDEFDIGTSFASISLLLTPTSSSPFRIYFNRGGTYLVDGNSADLRKVNIFDLTRMSLDNITTVEEAKAELLKRGVDVDEYNEYNAGKIKSTIISKIESWGYNLCNEIFESGTILRGEDYPSDLLKRTPNANRIRVIAGKQYTLQGDYTGNYYIFEFDYNMNYIRRDDYNNSQGGSVTLLSDCYFVRLVVPTGATNVCFHRTGSRTGYAPYVGKLGQINIPNAPLKLDGVNDVHDLVTFEEQSDGSYNAILTNKFDIVDLGTLNWYYSNNRFYSVDLKNQKNDTKNCVCSKYKTHNGPQDSMVDKTITMRGDTGLAIWIMDSSYTDVASFKSAMSGVYLLFELATPTTEVIATGLTFERVATLFEKGGTIKAVYEEVPPTASVDFMTKGE